MGVDARHVERVRSSTRSRLSPTARSRACTPCSGIRRVRWNDTLTSPSMSRPPVRCASRPALMTPARSPSDSCSRRDAAHRPVQWHRLRQEVAVLQSKRLTSRFSDRLRTRRSGHRALSAARRRVWSHRGCVVPSWSLTGTLIGSRPCLAPAGLGARAPHRRRRCPRRLSRRSAVPADRAGTQARSRTGCPTAWPR